VRLSWKTCSRAPPYPILGNEHLLSLYELLLNPEQVLISWSLLPLPWTWPTPLYIHKTQQKAKGATVRKEAHLGLGRHNSILFTQWTTRRTDKHRRMKGSQSFKKVHIVATSFRNYTEPIIFVNYVSSSTKECPWQLFLNWAIESLLSITKRDDLNILYFPLHLQKGFFPPEKARWYSKECSLVRAY